MPLLVSLCKDRVSGLGATAEIHTQIQVALSVFKST